MTRSPRLQAFTLIELLVVISIIALLISILLPALGAARRSAQQSQCLAQLRSLGTVSMLYSADNEEYYVNFATTGALGPDGAPDWFWPGKFATMRYTSGIKAYLCPALPARFFATETNPASAASVDWQSIHYGYNSRHLGSKLFNPGTGLTFTPRGKVTPRTDDVKNAANKIVFVDVTNALSNAVVPGLLGSYRVQSVPTADAGRLDPRHQGKVMNIAWADGHGSAAATRDATVPYTTTEGITPANQQNNSWTPTGEPTL